MKVIIADTYGVKNYDVLFQLIRESGLTITEVVLGEDRKVDQLGELWAQRHNVPVRRFPIRRRLDGKDARRRRNERMALYADAMIACWSNASSDMKDLANCLHELGKFTYVYVVE